METGVSGDGEETTVVSRVILSAMCVQDRIHGCQWNPLPRDRASARMTRSLDRSHVYIVPAGGEIAGNPQNMFKYCYPFRSGQVKEVRIGVKNTR